MELNKETALLQTEFRKFSRDVMAAKADEYDKKSEVPRENIKRLADLGILGALVPESCGGVALDTIGTVVALEEISKVCPSTGLILAVHNTLFAYPLVKYGTDDQKKKYLPPVCGGGIIGGFAETATNELAIKIEGANYVLNGKNPLLLNGELNGAFLLIAATGEPAAVTAFIIETGQAGMKIVKNDQIIGMKAAGIAEVRFTDAVLAKSSILGPERKADQLMNDAGDLSHLMFAAVSLGIAQAAFENAVKYAKERVQFGAPIAHYGMVREMLVDMASKIESLRLLIYDAALARDGQKDYSITARMARLMARSAVADITTNTIQVYGGYGYMKDYPAERFFRDAQVIRVLGGTTAADKESIASKII